MRVDSTPQVRYLKDYTPYPYSVDSIDLDFNIHAGSTTVTTTMVMTRTTNGVTDIRLDGEMLELVSLHRDGVALVKDKDFTVDDTGMTLRDCPPHFTLITVTRIKPEENTALEGLYNSGSIYCTQCEAEGFRKITYFPDRPDVMTRYTVRIEADRARNPILLSNGNKVDEGSLGDDRHFAIWHDPFPKPCYLFALVAGDLRHIHDTFTTVSGRVVDLYIYTDPGNETRCDHAMASLKRSMKWDEDVYGCEYDLDIFNIVAVNDFNMGAMENKSLNIFNAKVILATPQTATDTDYLIIETIVAHEYFHNWSGNRVTCRDWFQLSLKEGFTVFRDQTFSADMHSPAVKRIEDVEMLRNRQFPEDASPMAHPIRPDNYIEINNFYTPTVYEKGAEVIRMFHTLLGSTAFRKATDLYFKRHDGQAATCDDFFACMQENTDLDLAQFKRWYSQAGTPHITVRHSYDSDSKRLTLTVSQMTPATFGQADKQPLHIPFAVGLLAKSDGCDLLKPATQVLHMRDAEQVFTFDNIPEPVTPSLLRDFSAPVKLTSDLTDDDLWFLLAHDSDGFNRWDSGQTALQRLILANAASGNSTALPDNARAAFARLLQKADGDMSLLAMAMTLPSENYLAQLCDNVDVDGIHAARNGLMTALGQTFGREWQHLFDRLAPPSGEHYAISQQQVGRRQLRGLALRYIQAADAAKGQALAQTAYGDAANMTDRMKALAVLADSDGAHPALADFHAFAGQDPLLLDKWFTVQAVADRADVVESVAALLQHRDFTFKNPNRLRALIGAFSMSNPAHFHRADGAGYRLLADAIITANRLNPQTAARLLGPLRQWRRYDIKRQALMESELNRILADKDISKDVYEIASKSLA